MTTLTGKTIIITGASRGIGREIALRCARDGANIVIAAKTVDDSGPLAGTIFDVAKEVEALGGKALPLQVDVRDADKITEMAEQAVKAFGRIDVMINNAGAIKLLPVEELPVKRFDLLLQVNVRASYACAQACIPHMKAAGGGHIINMSPPLNLKPHWIAGKTGYTITKFGMTMLTIGLAEELREHGIKANSLWPRTAIATAAINWIGGEEWMNASRKPAIMADAVYEMLTDPDASLTGKSLIDEDYLRSRGYTEFDHYAYKPGAALADDFYID